MGLIFVLGMSEGHCQIEQSLSIPIDTSRVKNTLGSIESPQTNTDSIIVAVDSLTRKETGDIETTIEYDADSIQMDLKNQMVFLFGNAQIIYGEIQLSAAEIKIDYTTHIITANGIEDSLGNKVGKPVFVEGSQTFETNDMKYNFESRKAIIDGIVTQQGEAVMQGKKVYKNQFDELFIADARYTTCNLADPHFDIEASKLKVIPGKKVVSGPFHINVNGIPTPIGFAFGIFPKKWRILFCDQ